MLAYSLGVRNPATGAWEQLWPWLGVSRASALGVP